MNPPKIAAFTLCKEYKPEKKLKGSIKIQKYTFYRIIFSIYDNLDLPIR
jgi:hypothetical protein